MIPPSMHSIKRSCLTVLAQIQKAVYNSLTPSFVQMESQMANFQETFAPAESALVGELIKLVIDLIVLCLTVVSAYVWNVGTWTLPLATNNILNSNIRMQSLKMTNGSTRTPREAFPRTR
jgi:hypothetical protein